MKELTKAEEQIMQILWDLEKGFVHDIIEQIPIPKPAYNTVSTIIRILEKKKFVDHKAYGKTHEYFPIVKRDDYKTKTLTNMLSNYFDNSYQKLASFYAKGENVSIDELKAIKQLIELELKEKEGGDNE